MAKKTKYKRMDLEDTHIFDLREIARTELGSDTWIAFARKHELVDAILAGKLPEKSYVRRRVTNITQRERDAIQELSTLAATLAEEAKSVGIQVTPDHLAYQTPERKIMNALITIINELGIDSEMKQTHDYVCLDDDHLFSSDEVGQQLEVVDLHTLLSAILELETNH